MSETVSLYSYLKRDCDKYGCKYNDEGCCLCDNGDFIIDRLDNVQDCLEGNLEDLLVETFDCTEAIAEEGTCLYCGELLEKVEETHPYGNTVVPEVYYACRHCD